MKKLYIICGLVSGLGCLPTVLLAQNTFLGAKAGAANQSGIQNTFIGYNAGLKSTATANTFVGYRAGANNTSGQYNSFIGVQAGQANTTGNANYFFGTNSGANNTTGNGNYFLGDNAGGGNTTGGYNVYIGANSGNGTNVNGDNNLALGYEAGRGNNAGINNTFIGFRADAGASSLSNATAIGNNAKVTTSNSFILGDGVNVGIGNTAPNNKLEITQGTTGNSGLRFTNLNSSFMASMSTNQFLTVNSSGDVVLAKMSSGGRQAASDADAGWALQASGNLANTNSGGVVIGPGIAQTPAGYRLYVADGVLTEKVKVAVKSTDEWSDKVFSPKYTLKDLSQVENYIQRHKHLPGIPSAEEMVKRGNDLHQTDAKLLEKIEELTLYSIQLKKTNQLQSDEIQSLKEQRQQDQQTLQDLKQKQAALEGILKQLLKRK